MTVSLKLNLDNTMTNYTYNNANTFAVSNNPNKPVTRSYPDLSNNKRAIVMVEHAINHDNHKADTFKQVVILLNYIYDDTVLFECDGKFLLHHVRAYTTNLSASPVYSLNDILRMLILESEGELAIDVGLPKIYNIYKYIRYTASEYDLHNIGDFTNTYINSIPDIYIIGNKYLVDDNFIQLKFLQNALIPHFYMQLNAYFSVLKSRIYN